MDSGIKFKRKDLQDEPTIDATIANLKTVERATTIGEGSMRVHTVEHILSSLSAMGIDNAVVEMDANEPPIGDGSAQPYVELIKKAGIVAQEAPRRVFDVREPIHIETKNGSHARRPAGSEVPHLLHASRARTASSRNFFPPRSPPPFTKRRSPLPAPLFIMRTSSRSWTRT